MYYEVFYREDSGNRQSLQIHDTSNKLAVIDNLSPSTRCFCTVRTVCNDDYPVTRSDESEELVGITGKV